jgi:hypothetical protein
MLSPAAWYPSHTTCLLVLPQHLPARCSAPYASLFDVSTLLDDRRVHCEEEVVEHLPRLAAVVPQPTCNPQPKPSQSPAKPQKRGRVICHVSRRLPRVTSSATCRVICHVSRRLPRVASSATLRRACFVVVGDSSLPYAAVTCATTSASERPCTGASHSHGLRR